MLSGIPITFICFLKAMNVISCIKMLFARKTRSVKCIFYFLIRQVREQLAFPDSTLHNDHKGAIRKRIGVADFSDISIKIGRVESIKSSFPHLPKINRALLVKSVALGKKQSIGACLGLSVDLHMTEILVAHNASVADSRAK